MAVLYVKHLVMDIHHNTGLALLVMVEVTLAVNVILLVIIGTRLDVLVAVRLVTLLVKPVKAATLAKAVIAAVM